MNTPIPDFFKNHSTAYNKITKMAKDFPNDQQFGLEVRRYLNDIKENGFWKPNTIELDGLPDINIFDMLHETLKNKK